MFVQVVPYRPQWPELYRQEAEKIRHILGNQLDSIHHIGSTSVPGLAAKPIIDMLPVVYRIEAVDAFDIEFEALGYEVMGEFGIPGRRYFRKGAETPTYHIHIFQKSDAHNIGRHLAVRDYLRTHQADAAAYASLKLQLAAQFPWDIEAYCDGKDAFVKELEQKALAWMQQNHLG